MRLVLINDNDEAVGNWLVPDTADAGDIQQVVCEAFDWVECESCRRLLKSSQALEQGGDFYCLNCCRPKQR